MPITTKKVIYLQLSCLRYSELQAFLSARVHLLGCNILKIHTKEVEEIGNENSKKNVLYTRKFWHCTTILHDPRMNV